ncbi:MAG TPA: START-like domain-containing protein [Cytophagaceae bacterium]|jgi:uncharacterized protein YndB with AHSA1/START domain|nr:START-like domain-containing protein [Cytophagaceae bacterium]
MSRKKLTYEFEINTPASLLYSYLTVPNSLKQWFADDVIEDKAGTINFKWEGDDHFAKISMQKVNQLIRYDFLSPKEGGDSNDPAFIEFKIEVNELTQTSFLKITDSYMEESEQDAAELWKNLINDLKDTIGA